MKKRTLLILALGVSFTPAVFAAGPLGEPAELRTGQTSYSDTMERFPESVGCNLQNKKEAKQKEVSANFSHNKGNAGVGH